MRHSATVRNEFGHRSASLYVLHIVLPFGSSQPWQNEQFEPNKLPPMQPTKLVKTERGMLRESSNSFGVRIRQNFRKFSSMQITPRRSQKALQSNIQLYTLGQLGKRLFGHTASLNHHQTLIFTHSGVEIISRDRIFISQRVIFSEFNCVEDAACRCQLFDQSSHCGIMQNMLPLWE